MVYMVAEKTQIRSIRIFPRTNRNMLMATRYFGCSTDTLLALMLDATRIAPITNEYISEETIDNFYKEVNALTDGDIYLLRD